MPVRRAGVPDCESASQHERVAVEQLLHERLHAEQL